MLASVGYGNDAGVISAVQAVINGMAPEESLYTTPGMKRLWPTIKNQIDPTYNATRYEVVQQFKNPEKSISQAISAINTAYEHI